MNEITCSFLCPTYGRISRQPHLLEEMLYWFTRQTWPNCELVILNDRSCQEIKCTVPNVRVVNEQRRYPTLGDKMNALVEMAAGDICLVSEDDDLSLPHRAEQAVDHLGYDYDYWSPQFYWFAPGGGPSGVIAEGRGIGHNCAAYRRTAFLGKYPSVSKGHDAIVHHWALDNLKCNRTSLTDPKECSYIYRWNVSDYHLSGQADMELGYRKAPAGNPGPRVLAPKMPYDWTRLTNEVKAVIRAK